MSRIGKQPVVLPAGVKADVKDGTIRVEGPLGKISLDFVPEVDVALKDGRLLVTRTTSTRQARACHGLMRALLANAVHGVKEGYKKNLDIVGVGYNAKLDGKTVVLSMGFANLIRKPIPEGLTVEIPNPTRIVVKGADRQLVGQFAAEIRKVRPPEPYNGKGIKYDIEVIKRKAGKAFVGGEK